MGRLDDIRKRNEGGGYGFRHHWAFSLRSLFLLVIIVLLAVTKWATPPPDHRPGIIIIPDKTFRPAYTPTSGGTLMMSSHAHR